MTIEGIRHRQGGTVLYGVKEAVDAPLFRSLQRNSAVAESGLEEACFSEDSETVAQHDRGAGSDQRKGSEPIDFRAIASLGICHRSNCSGRTTITENGGGGLYAVGQMFHL